MLYDGPNTVQHDVFCHTRKWTVMLVSLSDTALMQVIQPVEVAS